ncbi:KAP family P-loop NTPase fold protein [Arcticibacterium luteifluviistationis]|uniref:KAP NTPase domain-containing protein n=1 Tax=Arcticibacterium luteifluviistationis TaxID=1784714 RepID=A0A2Z4GC43_9BACT|nr:P-loop NTPase fold protein [Arcticibacterium luteifluviistationis]AWV98786.1 hypothetical protein DJ013_11615 [Arcticibacterium luteifluviistationis]
MDSIVKNKKKDKNLTWNKIDWKVWFEDFKQISLTRVLIFCLVFYCSYGILEPYYFESFLNEMFFKFKLDWPIRITIVLVLLILLFKIFRKIKSGFIPRPSRLVSLILFLIIYIYKWRWNGLYEFDTVFGDSLVWFDFVPLSIAVLLLDFRAYFKPFDIEDESKALIYELKDEGNNEVKDLYHRDYFAETVADLISNSSNTKESTVIGIFSEWGSGKTDFLKRLKSRLNKSYESENIVREFNPWRSSSGNDITEAFFSFLQGELKQYDSSINSHLKNYMNEILGSSKAVSVRFIHSLMNKFLDSSGDKPAKEQIQESLKLTGKRFVIYLDDVDRLTSSEIIEVFKLVRVIADFPNLFFVITMDYNFVIATVDESKEISDIEGYLKKIFNVFFRLPVVKHETISNQIIELASKDFDGEALRSIEELVNVFGKKEINNEKEVIKGLLEEALINSRDVVSFYNSFRIVFKSLGRELDITDLFLLELLKTYSFEDYNKLSQRELDVVFKELRDGVDYEGLEDSVVKGILKEIRRDDGDRLKRLANPINFYLYFSYCIPTGIISREEFYAVLLRSDEDFLNEVDGWSIDNRVDLRNILQNHPFKGKLNDLIKFIKAYLLVGGSLGFNEYTQPSLVENLQDTLKGFGLTRKKQKVTIKDILLVKKIGLKNRMEFAHFFLHQDKYNIGKIFNKSSDVLGMMNLIFSEALSDRDNKYKEDLYGLLLKMDSTPQSSSKGLDSKACENYYNHLQNNSESLAEYIRSFFRGEWIGSSDVHYVADPFLLQIFKTIPNFKELISSNTFQEGEAKSLAEIITGIDNKSFSEKAIILKGGDVGYDYVHELYSERLESKNQISPFLF